MASATKSAEILALLSGRGIEYVVVGMQAAVLQGAPVITFDLDVVHRQTPSNLAKLTQALRDIDAVYRGDPRRLTPSESHLAGPGHQLLETSLGILDCLGSIDHGRRYEDLLDKTRVVQVGGHAVRVLELAELIEIKRRAGRPKDLAVIPVLESTIDEVEGR